MISKLIGMFKPGRKVLKKGYSDWTFPIKQQQGLLQQANNPQMAAMGRPAGQNMPMPTTRDAAMRGLLR